MNILEDFYERLLNITEEKKLSSRKLKKCYKQYLSFLEVGELYVEEYNYDYKALISDENLECIMKVIKKDEKLYINPATCLVFKKYDPHPMFQRDMYVCIGVDKNDELEPLTMTEVLICQNNNLFFNINSCIGSSSEIPEDFYAIKL